MELLEPNNCIQSENINFSIFRDNKLQKISLWDLLSRKQVLICSLPRVGENIVALYSDYVREISARYEELYDIKTYFIKVRLLSIAPSHRALSSPFKKQSPKSLHDTNKDFTRYLASQVNNKLDISTLSYIWGYQVLFNNRKIEKFYEQPTENCMKQAIKFIYKNPQLLSRLRARDNLTAAYLAPDSDKIFQRRRLGKFENDIRYGQTLYFHNLWPNTDLDQYLLDKYPGHTL